MLLQKTLLFVLCFALGLSGAACVSVAKDSPPAPESPGAPPKSTTFINTLSYPKGPFLQFALPKLTAQALEKKTQNGDTVGWLKAPGTTVDDVVLWYPGDENRFYYRRNFEKRESFNGSYFADYRCSFGAYAKDLAPNTVIYGHSMSDDPNDARGLFSPLKLFKDESFARKTPYIYFSTTGEDLLWEVFAVFNTTVALAYNLPRHPDLAGLIAQCRELSLFDYDVKVDENDKILTLSTCIYYRPGDGAYLGYPNDYRYVIMARLVKDISGLKNEASLVKNPGAV